jgi:hypothetical protein
MVTGQICSDVRFGRMLRHELARKAGGVTYIACVVTKVFDRDSLAT